MTTAQTHRQDARNITSGRYTELGRRDPGNNILDSIPDTLAAGAIVWVEPERGPAYPGKVVQDDHRSGGLFTVKELAKKSLIQHVVERNRMTAIDTPGDQILAASSNELAHRAAAAAQILQRQLDEAVADMARHHVAAALLHSAPADAQFVTLVVGNPQPDVYQAWPGSWQNEAGDTIGDAHFNTPLASWTGSDPAVASWQDSFVIDTPDHGRIIDMHAVRGWALTNL